MALQLTRWKTLDGAGRAQILERPAMRDDANVSKEVKRIVTAVRGGGDSVVRELTERFDRAQLESFRVGATEVAAAEASLSGEDLAAIDLAIENVRRFHEQQLPTPLAIETMPGVLCERISHPLDSVGLYVPAGTAPLPSAAIMLAVPAMLAGCPTRVLCTPPRPDGKADPAVIAAATRAGVHDIFKIGGAQAVAALAYGTESVPKVLKIFGPGNAWVTSAKKLVSADAAGAAIDMPAGPSEVLIIADAGAAPEFVAADLLSQAEHGIDSQVILLTVSAKLAKTVNAEIESQLQTLSRANIARQALANSRCLLLDSIEEAIAISNRYAPEHLILQIDAPRSALAKIRNAGSIFLGPWSPEAVGDYCSGTNHVLPTYGYAGAYSGLGVDQFLRSMTVQELSQTGLSGLSEAVVRLANLEGLDAHAAAIQRRIGVQK